MIVIGLDRNGQKHYLDDETRQKGCGRFVTLCGLEAVPVADPQPDDSGVCPYCIHARPLGQTVLRQGKKVTQPE